MTQSARLSMPGSEFRDERLRGRIGVVMVDRAEPALVDEPVERPCQFPVLFPQKGPVEMFARKSAASIDRLSGHVGIPFRVRNAHARRTLLAAPFGNASRHDRSGRIA
jgi:hypothetical protein